MEAAIKDDTAVLKLELANLFERDDPAWLLVACQNNIVNFVEEVILRKPNLAWGKNHDGQTAIHIACKYGHVEIVQALLKITPDLCFLRDGRELTPLHIATIKGDIPIMRTLLDASPQSLVELTSLDETPLHLAVKYDQIGAFKLLMEEIPERKQKKILQKMDYEGNNVFHIATVHKRIEILRWLLVDNPKRGPLVRVNSRNRRGFTALDLHFHNSSELKDRHITLLLHRAGAMTTGQSSSSHSKSDSPVILAACTLIASAAYSYIFNLIDTSTSVGNKAPAPAHRVGDIISNHRELLPEAFYCLVFMTVAFTVSMIGLLFPLQSMTKEGSFPFRALPLLGLTAFSFSYAFILKANVPKFWVTTESFEISSFLLVWLYAAPLILVLLITWFVAKRFLPIFRERNKCKDGVKISIVPHL